MLHVKILLGYIVFVGELSVKGGSGTHTTPALSSGEDEYYSITRGGSEAIGLQSNCADLGIELQVRVHTDSSAAKSLTKRVGLSKMRHLAARLLWVQHYVKKKIIEVLKVKGTENCSDMCTKHMTRAEIDKYMKIYGQEVREGRAALAPALAGDYEEASAHSIFFDALLKS